MEILIERFITGPIETNTYIIVSHNQHVLIVDPSSECEAVIKRIKEHHYIPDAIVITHGHFDHHLGLNEILQSFPGLPVYIHPKEKIMLTQSDKNGSGLIGYNWNYTGEVSDLNDGQMQIGSFQFSVIGVPGHSPYGCAILMDNHLICGDILFAGSIGRSDLPGGDGDLLVKGIREKLLILPDDTIVCPGHGGRTTIAREKRHNPYLQ